MVTGMDFGLLGPLAVRRGGLEVPVLPGKQTLYTGLGAPEAGHGEPHQSAGRPR